MKKRDIENITIDLNVDMYNLLHEYVYKFKLPINEVLKIVRFFSLKKNVKKWQLVECKPLIKKGIKK